MIEERSAIVLRSELNEWINICITVDPYEDFHKVKEIASKAYDKYWNSDTTECISDYIKRKLDEADCSYEMFLGDFNEDEEEE
jgi:hypothetical protein